MVSNDLCLQIGRVRGARTLRAEETLGEEDKTLPYLLRLATTIINSKLMLEWPVTAVTRQIKMIVDIFSFEPQQNPSYSMRYAKTLFSIHLEIRYCRVFIYALSDSVSIFK